MTSSNTRAHAHRNALRRAVLALVVTAALGAIAPSASAQFDGWAVGINGTIVHTSNGGTTWTPQASGTANHLSGVSFEDPNNLWAVGYSGTIVHTSNGGITWSPQTSGTGNDLFAVSFVDPNNGWAVGDSGTIVHTSNGGSTWSAQTSGTGFFLDGVSFVDPNNGWVVGDSGTILHTSNGGSTWSAQTSGTGFRLGGVSFVDPNNGWVVGDSGMILHTSNGGSTWSPQTSGTGLLLIGVSFVDPDNGWAVGEIGTILHTSNGGSTWSPQTSGTTNSPFGVSFVDPDNGWAVAENGTILHTSNGGTTWSSQTSGTTVLLRGVSFVAPHLLHLRYFSNLSNGDSYIDLTNDGSAFITDSTGASTQNICVNVYTFDANEEMVSCCTCPITPDGLKSLSVKNDLVSNTLTPGVPLAVVVKLVETTPVLALGANGDTLTGGCDATLGLGYAGNPSETFPTYAVHAWGATPHLNTATSSFDVTETGFSTGTLGKTELAHLAQTCGFINSVGSGFGICKSCQVRGLGAAQE